MRVSSPGAFLEHAVDGSVFVDLGHECRRETGLGHSHSGAVTRRAVAQRRSRVSGLTRPSAEAIRGFGLGFVAVSVPPVQLRFAVSLLFLVFYL